ERGVADDHGTAVVGNAASSVIAERAVGYGHCSVFVVNAAAPDAAQIDRIAVERAVGYGRYTEVGDAAAVARRITAESAVGNAHGTVVVMAAAAGRRVMIKRAVGDSCCTKIGDAAPADRHKIIAKHAARDIHGGAKVVVNATAREKPVTL